MYGTAFIIRNSYVDKQVLTLKNLRKILLFPCGILYGTAAWLRRQLYQCGCEKVLHPAVPTVCVGNLAVGGTGKTPHVEYLIRLLTQKYRIAILSRGYKRKTKGFLSTFETPGKINANAFGDEPMQYFHKFPKTQIAVCENRAVGIQKLMAMKNPPQVIVLDDAFQHLRVACGLKILLTEYASLFTKDCPLPAGNLREFPSAANVADLIVVTKSPKLLSDNEAKQVEQELRRHTSAPVFFSTYHYGNPVPLNDKAQMTQLSANTKVILLTGIAHPQPLVDKVKSQYDDVEVIGFQDHHNYSERDLMDVYLKYCAERTQNTVVFTTEKDAMRLKIHNLKKIVSLLPFFTIPVKVEFLLNQEENFNKIIQNYVGKN